MIGLQDFHSDLRSTQSVQYDDNTPFNSTENNDGLFTPKVVIIVPSQQYAKNVGEYCNSFSAQTLCTVAVVKSSMNLMLDADIVIA